MKDIVFPPRDVQDPQLMRNFCNSVARWLKQLNAGMGVATLVGGTVTVADTTITATSRIFLTSQTDGGTPGFLRVSGRTPGASFTITSSSGTDTSTVAYQIYEPR